MHLAYAFIDIGYKIWDKVIIIFSQANRYFDRDLPTIQNEWERNFNPNNNAIEKAGKLKVKKGEEEARKAEEKKDEEAKNDEVDAM